MAGRLLLAGLAAVSTAAAMVSKRLPPAQAINSATCNGKYYSYNQLAGYGFVPSAFRDKFGDTVGGHGSAIALDLTTWTLNGDGTYTGILWTLPDRGW